MKYLTFFTILFFSVCWFSCEENKSGPSAPPPPAPKTYSVTVYNNLTNNHRGNINVRIDASRFPVIKPGEKHTVTGITEGIHTISADGVGFINISAQIPVYENFHACLECNIEFGSIPFWCACPP